MHENRHKKGGLKKRWLAIDLQPFTNILAKFHRQD
jgi:hypothetical protein